MSFFSSSRVNPTASLAATLAIGKPVALEARADERDTRGFISITTSAPSFGFTPNWMLDPPVSTPISVITARPASRNLWYSRSVKVMAGATVILVGRRLEALEATAVRINGGVPIACDVTDESDVVSLFAQVKARFGPCDILINSAGIMNAATPTVDLTADVFSDLLAVNVTGPFLTSREAFKHMKSPRNSSHMDECLEEDAEVGIIALGAEGTGHGVSNSTNMPWASWIARK